MTRNGHKAGWVVAENGCHIWQGGKDGNGYGTTYIDGKSHIVHRVRYELEVGPIPEGLVMDHFVCDNGPGGCCNPLHVRPVTRRENNLRSNSLAARYAARTHCDKGHLLGGDNAIPSRMAGEGSRLCKTCYNEKRKVWRKARLARGLPR